MRSAVFFAVLVVLAFFCISVSDLHGQSRTNQSGTGGINEIRGRVYLPNGKSPDEPFEVELQGNFTSLKVWSDRSGSFSFLNLAPGNYTVVIDGGEQFETFREYTTIDTEAQTATVRIAPIPKVINVPVYLQFKKDRREEILKNEVINAKWANVPKDAMDSYNHAIELIKSNKSDQAVIELRKAIQISPSFAPAHTALGKLFMLTGKLDDAIPEFEAAVRYDSSDFDARLNYGIALLNKRELPNAKAELSQAADINKSAITPRYYLGILFIQTKELDSAQKEMEEAKQLAGTKIFPLLHRYLGGIYMAKRLNKEAVAELETYIHQDPNAKDADRIRQTISDLKTKLN